MICNDKVCKQLLALGERHTLRKPSSLMPSLSTIPYNLDTVLDIYKNKLLSNPIFIQHELWLTS